MNKYFTNALLYIQYYLLFLTIIFTSIFYHAFNSAFYKNFYYANNTAEKLKITPIELEGYTDNLLIYLKENLPLDSYWYTTKDILHMVDVRNLYSFFYNINIIMIVTIAIINILLRYKLKKQYLQILINKFNKIFILFCLILTSLILFINYNFNYFWIKFHEIFFSNDLWLLSPSESNLIKMFPEDFFYSLVVKIIITVLISYLLIFTLKVTISKIIKLK